MRKPLFAILAATLVAGCATDIHPKDETIQPPKVKLGTFQSVRIMPLIVERSEGDSGDLRAIQRIGEQVQACMSSVFGKGIGQPAQAGAPALVVSPSIVDLKKVNVSERFFLGSLAGSSAALLKVTYTDASTNEVIAAPVHYAKANAWGGGFSVGVTDNKMLTWLTDRACDYARLHY